MSKVVVLTGSAGAGKSTVGVQFAISAPGVWAYVDQDEVRKQVKVGFKYPAQGWDEQTHIQWDVSVNVCADMARRYQAAGINLLLDCYVPPRDFDKWLEALAKVEYEIIVLLPSLENALKRNSKRTGAARLKDELIIEHHAWFQKYEKDKRIEALVQANSSVKDTVNKIQRILGGDQQ